MESHSLRDFLGNPIFEEIETVSNTTPTACGECRWRDMCRGGDLENRFSAVNGFDNPSVYCDAYKGLYATVCKRLVEGGYPAHLVKEKFRSEEHTSELQSLMRISYAVFCLKKKIQTDHICDTTINN